MPASWLKSPRWQVGLRDVACHTHRGVVSEARWQWVDYTELTSWIARQISVFFSSINGQLNVRLTDSSLSRDVFPHDYHCLGDNENRPVKWMALESLKERKYSTATDMVRTYIVVLDVVLFSPFLMFKILHLNSQVDVSRGDLIFLNSEYIARLIESSIIVVIYSIVNSDVVWLIVFPVH